jgi:phosphoenolpyruvate-protein phosphotransferase
MFKGIAASPGIIAGKAVVFLEEEIVVDRGVLSANKVKEELDRLEKAIEKTKTQLVSIQEKTAKEWGNEKADIFAAHIMILHDVVLIDDIKDQIVNKPCKAEYAVTQVLEKHIDMFSQIEDEYLKERAADIKDVGNRLLRNLLGQKLKSLADITEEVVVVAKDLTPSDTALMNTKYVKAFATDVGGRTSHTAIMARTLEIPAVVGLRDITAKVKNGDYIIVDGLEGAVYVNPDESILQDYRARQEKHRLYIDELKALKDLPAKTKDGARRVELSANIGNPQDCEGALANGAEGVGLYRTEFLFMDRNSLPDEEEQFGAYKIVAETMSPFPVIVRTLDIGGDKKLPCLEMPDEMNPFLGWRAIRMCLDRTDILKTQLRAILRASFYGKIRIMYPMISNIEEIRKANAILKQAKDELDQGKIPYDNQLQVGIMVEIPSAAVIADILAKEVDFFSIGTNDLIQYTIAVDRMNQKISHLYNPFHPAVLRLIQNVIDASHRAGKWTGMCGEMAGEVIAAPILLGMGLDEFSMSAMSIPHVKKIIRSMSYEEAQEMARQVMHMEDSEKIRMYSANIIKIEERKC